MVASKSVKSCLLITYGPVPTPQYKTVEGGGMRVWGLAKGLLDNGIDVTVGVNQSFPQSIDEHEGVRLISWSLDDTFVDTINSYDVIIMSYCMGDPSVFVADNIRDGVQLILDLYVPIYVEVSARNAKDIDTEYVAYMADVQRFNHVLKRGDYFLCASPVQKTFYTGVLGSLSIINPRSYRENRLIITPFGIHRTPAKPTRNPYTKLGIKETDFTVMWFGGLYPWFHIQELLDAVLELSKISGFKFVIVGGKNPFNPNPDFAKQYEVALTFAKESGLLNETIFFVDWVDFEDRINWFKYADLVVSLNQPGEENAFSWRTRIIDFVWGELAILTNAGDPLSEDLINHHAAFRLQELSAKALVESINDLHKHPAKLRDVRRIVKSLKPAYHWDSITQPTAEIIRIGQLPYSNERLYKNRLGVGHEHQDTMVMTAQGRLRKIVEATPRIISKARKKGVFRSVKLASGIAATQINKHSMPSSHKRYIFISNPINNTGAPLVLLQIIEEFVAKYGSRYVQVVAPGIEAPQLQRLRELGVRVDKAALGLGFHFIRMQLGLRKDDFVLMNTVAIYDNYRDFILLWLRNGRLKQAFWFIHEDKAQLPSVHREFLDEHNIKQTHSLIENSSLIILTPSERTKQEYDELLHTKSSHAISLLVEIDKKFMNKHAARDYNTINFLISGTPADARKGQLLALMAFYNFLKTYQVSNPSKYRDFKLHLVAIGNDYVSQQIRWISESLMEKNVVLYPVLTKQMALEVTAKCNAVICCSLNETFGLYVAEGMLMGHVVLRNNSAGVDEQLRDGVNGYSIDHTDLPKFTATIEKVLNRQSTSNERLQEMGHASQEIIKKYTKNSYLSQINSIETIRNGPL